MKTIEINLKEKSWVDEATSNEALLSVPLVSPIENVDDEDRVDRYDCQDYWISRRDALGLGSAFSSFPAWSFKTP